MNAALALTETARAFDAVAPEYDGPLGNNTLIQRMRSRVIEKIAATFPRGAHLLDMGCGTGIDALDLALRGYRIVAIDPSHGMVERTRARISAARLEPRVSVIQCGIHELGGMDPCTYDGLYSNFGPLNCVPDLRAASREMARLLRPGGSIIASVMGKYCPWELAFYSLHGNLQRSRSRLTKEFISVSLQSEKVWTYYYSPREFYHALADEFQIVSLAALNVFLPPPYLNHAYERYRNLFAPLASLDDKLGALPFIRNFGDHFLIELQKRN